MNHMETEHVKQYGCLIWMNTFFLIFINSSTMNQVFLLQSESIDVLQCKIRMHSLCKTEQDKVLVAKQLLKTSKQTMDAKTERTRVSGAVIIWDRLACLNLLGNEFIPSYINCRFQAPSLSKNHNSKNYMVQHNYIIKQTKIQLSKHRSPTPSAMVKGAGDYKQCLKSCTSKCPNQPLSFLSEGHR